MSFDQETLKLLNDVTDDVGRFYCLICGAQWNKGLIFLIIVGNTKKEGLVIPKYFILQWLQMIDWSKTGVSNVAGEISLLAGLGLWVTTFPRIRRKMFELFFYTHHLYILFMFFFILHVGISYCCMMLPGFYLFLVDRYLRFLQSRHRVRLLSARVLPCDAVELNFSKSPGDHHYINSLFFKFAWTNFMHMVDQGWSTTLLA